MALPSHQIAMTHRAPRIHAGFQRGRKGEPKEATLAEATALMQTKGGYMRVYWQGTAILLAADVELRRLSDGKQSLDTVLEAFGRCCLDPDPEWRARDVFARFDQLSGTNVFTTLLAAQIDAKGFPDLSGLYRQLGLRALGGKLEVESEPGLGTCVTFLLPLLHTQSSPAQP